MTKLKNLVDEVTMALMEVLDMVEGKETSEAIKDVMAIMQEQEAAQ